MEYQSREIKAGLLVLASFIALAAFIMTITGIDWERTEKHYTARLGYIGGIEPGSMVRFGGFLVGTVTDMYISNDDNTKIDIVLTLDARTPVRVDSEAFISSLGLMSEYYIEITPGSREEELLSSGSHIRSRDVPPLSRLGEPFMNVSEQLGLLLIQANDLLNDTNRQRFSNILANTDSLFNDNAEQVIGLVENVNTLAVQMQNISEKLDRLLGDNAQTMDSTIRHFDATLSSADSLLQTFNQSAMTMNNMAVANQASFYEMMQNFEVASQNLQMLSRTLKERPWLLVRKAAPPERKLP